MSRSGTGIWYGRAGGDGGDNVFSLTFDTSTGQYTFTLLDNLDHPVAGTEDNIVTQLQLHRHRFDGDTATGSFSVEVDDDMPVATRRHEFARQRRLRRWHVQRPG